MVDDGRVLALGRGRQRALLALLLLNANELVPQDRLIDVLWGERPPRSAITKLHGHVSGLRRLLGPDRVVTEPPGYLLRVAPGELDVYHCERLLVQERFADALALWRGSPLCDQSFESFAQSEIARLDELQLTGLEGFFDHELAAGRHGPLVGELAAMVKAHPLRERFAAQLMLALYRSGRQADALDAFHDARGRLVDGLGLEPGEELSRLQRQILEHNGALDLARPTKLPAAATSFVGRERELAQVRALLARPDVRLLTLTGAGGTGKTRLALAVAGVVADRHEDGARYVGLGAVRDAEDVASTIAAGLGLRPSGGQSILDALTAFVRERELLLLVDNFEHVLDAGPLLGELLAAAPRLTVLVTSRVHLNLYGENEYAVPPLAEAVALFVDRAQAVRSDFALTAENRGAVEEICARLDGLPLAIELAAARMRTLTTAEIRSRLERRLELLTGGPRDVPARQRTLRDALLWSHDLLTPLEQRLFARLGVFAGGWSLEAADTVCCGDLALTAADGLRSLCEKNLVRAAGPRFEMLQTIGDLASERLVACGELNATAGDHARWCLALAEDQGPNRRGTARAAWLARVALEHDNMRAALVWTATDAGDPEIGLRLAGAMLGFWLAHGLLPEGGRSAAMLLSRSAAPTVGRARALAASAMFAGLTGRLEIAERACRENFALAREGEEWYRAVSLNVLGTAMRYRGRLGDARPLYDEALSLATAHDLWWPRALAHGNLGVLDALDDRLAESADHWERSLAIARDGGDDWLAATSLSRLGRAAGATGDTDRAASLQREALWAFAELDNPWGVAVCLDAFAALAADHEDFVRAARLYGAEEAVLDRAGIGVWETIRSEHEAGVQQTAAALGVAAWSRARREGRSLTTEQAIAEARAAPSSVAIGGG